MVDLHLHALLHSTVNKVHKSIQGMGKGRKVGERMGGEERGDGRQVPRRCITAEFLSLISHDGSA